jgi:hypothetical protein
MVAMDNRNCSNQFFCNDLYGMSSDNKILSQVSQVIIALFGSRAPAPLLAKAFDTFISRSVWCC